MNNRELDRLLKTVPLPERDEAYWREFPESVSRRIRAGAVRNQAPIHQNFGTLSKWRWWAGFAGAAAAVVLYAAWEIRRDSRSDEQLQLLRTFYRQTAELFPRQLEAVILGADGLQLQLSEAPDLPASPPLFVRICPPSSRCITAVSFSGRKIRVSGEEFEILANGAGEILLMAKDGVWTSRKMAVSGKGWKFESGWLERSL